MGKTQKIFEAPLSKLFHFTVIGLIIISPTLGALHVCFIPSYLLDSHTQNGSEIKHSKNETLKTRLLSWICNCESPFIPPAISGPILSNFCFEGIHREFLHFHLTWNCFLCLSLLSRRYFNLDQEILFIFFSFRYVPKCVCVCVCVCVYRLSVFCEKRAAAVCAKRFAFSPFPAA